MTVLFFLRANLGINIQLMKDLIEWKCAAEASIWLLRLDP